MDDTNKLNSELLRYVDFHLRSRAGIINTINGITSKVDIVSHIAKTFELLQRQYDILFYSGKSTNTRMFLNQLEDGLRREKAILIVADTLDFDPIIYDQLMTFREKNEFTASIKAEPIKNKFPSSSKIFLFYQAKSEERKLYDISDHVLDLNN